MAVTVLSIPPLMATRTRPCLLIIVRVLLILYSVLHIFGFSTLLAQQRGMASVFPDEFHGRKTASGEEFNKNKYHAAHPKLAFGEKLTVYNPVNKKSVQVTIVDRGPFLEDKIIEVSSRVARELGIPQGGEVLLYNEKPPPASLAAKGGKDTEKTKPTTSIPPIPDNLSRQFTKGNIYRIQMHNVDSGKYFIQVAALSKYDAALQLVAKLQGLGYQQIVLRADNRFIKVAIGPFPSILTAKTKLDRLIAHGYKPIVIPW